MSTDNRQEQADEQTDARQDVEAVTGDPGEVEVADQGPSGNEAGENALPEWAVRQMDALQASEQNEDAGADGDPIPEAADGGQLPDWAVRKMAQFEASEGNDLSPDDDGQVAQSGFGGAPVAAETALEPAVASQVRQSAPNLEMMLDLPLDATVELGRAELPLAEVLTLKSGSVIQLDRLPGEPLDLLVNGQLVARGEIVVLNDTFAFRITDLAG